MNPLGKNLQIKKVYALLWIVAELNECEFNATGCELRCDNKDCKECGVIYLGCELLQS